MPRQIRAMVLAGDVLFTAGWPDAVTIAGQTGPGAAHNELRKPRLWAISPADGEVLAEYELDALPVFDGAVAASGRLFVTLQDGTVVCFGGTSG